MTEQITITPKAELNSAPSNSGQTSQNISLNRTQLTNYCAAGLAVCFFLPWIQVLGVGVSPFGMQKIEEADARLLWLIPIFSAITIFAGIAKFGQRIAARLTGLLPLCVVAYWYKDAGSNLTNVLSYGAYFSCILGTALVTL